MMTEKLGLAYTDDDNHGFGTKPMQDDDTHYFKSYEANGTLVHIKHVN